MSDPLPTPARDATTMWTSESAPPPKGHDPLMLYRMAHRALRGRYPLLIALVVVGTLFGAGYAYKNSGAVYRSEGLLRIPFRRAPLSDEAESLGQMTVFREFLRSQVQVMTSDRVVARAIDKWEALRPKGETPQGRAARFAGALSVLHPPDTEHLLIGFNADEPKIAASGVRAAIEAYVEHREEEIRSRQAAAVAERDEGPGEFQKQMDLLQSMERDIAMHFDPGDTRRDDGTLTQQGRGAEQAFNPRVGPVDKTAEGPLTINQIAIIDPLMRSYLEQQAMMRAELQRLEKAGGMDKNPYTVMLKTRLEQLTKMMDKYAEEFRKFQLSRRNPNSVVSAGAPSMPDRLAELRLVEVDRQMTELKTGGTFAGKPSIISAGTVPLLPMKERTLVTLVGGGIVVAIIPAALLVILGLVSRRVRSADDIAVTTGAPALLGILPQLPDGTLDESRRAMWSFCVHQVRAILEARHGHQRPSAYLITSASPAEGKTRLTSALARSFAESGSRTLMVDCDLISQGLTRRMGVQPGRDLMDCLREGSVMAAVHPTEDMNLAVLPLRRGGSVDGLPKGAIKRMLDDARRNFDIILIDSGLVLGSIEASLLAPEVDGVILAVTRGQQQPLVERSIRHIHGVGGQVLGAVFNRARFSRLRTSTPAPLIPETPNGHTPAAGSAPRMPDAPIANVTWK